MEITNTKDTSIHHVNYLIFGASKTGKTVLATTVPSNELLFINTEDNLSSIYGADVNKVDCFTYESVIEVAEAIEQKEITPKWLFIDSITDLSKRLLVDEMSKTNHGMKAYGEVGQKIPELIRRMKALPLNLVAIAQQGLIKDEVTGGVIFGADMVGQKLACALPFMFDSVLATRILLNDKKEQQYVIQCKACTQYQVGVRTRFDNPDPLSGFEKPNLLQINNKILT